MISDDKIEKYLCIAAVIFITYLLLGSIIVSKNIFEIVYLIIFYGIIIYVKLKK